MSAAFKTSKGGPDHSGWLQLELNNDGAGKIISWAYENVSGAPIEAGAVSPVPEPGTALGGAALLLACVIARGRGRVICTNEKNIVRGKTASCGQHSGTLRVGGDIGGR
jgi:hypothetical protein